MNCQVCDGKITDIPYELKMAKNVDGKEITVYDVKLCRKCGQRLEKKIGKIFERTRENV